MLAEEVRDALHADAPYSTNAMSEEKCATFDVGRMAQDQGRESLTMRFELHA
jgi:hypothetical protein